MTMFEQASPGEWRNQIADWVLRGAITLVFVLFGLEKFPSAPGTPWVKLFQQIGFGQWFRYFTGVVEIIGGAHPRFCDRPPRGQLYFDSVLRWPGGLLVDSAEPVIAAGVR